MGYAGRRTLYVNGLAILTLLLLLIGLVSISNTKGASWGIGSLLLVYTFTYDITVGPVCIPSWPKSPPLASKPNL